MSYVPSLRGISGLVSAKADGSCGRSAQLENTHPYKNLIHINVVVAQSELSVWSSSPTYKLTSKEDLFNLDHKIGIVRGASRPKHFIDMYGLAATELTSLTVGLKMLHAGRLDLIIASTITIPTVLEDEPNLIKPHKVLTLEQADLYPYLTQEHRDLETSFTKKLHEFWPTHYIEFTNFQI